MTVDHSDEDSHVLWEGLIRRCSVIYRKVSGILIHVSAVLYKEVKYSRNYAVYGYGQQFLCARNRKSATLFDIPNLYNYFY